MTKMQALYQFFASFGVPAYEENSVYSDRFEPEFPYLTYSVSLDSFSENEVALSCSFWYRDYSWQLPEQKAEEMSKSLGQSGMMLKCDGGRIWLKRGSPFAQAMADPSDNLIKRMYINISVEFLTVD